MKDLFIKLIQSDSKESSKRFLAVYIVCFLGLIITSVALYKDVDYILLLGTWLTFAAGLLGLSEYNKNRKEKYSADIEKEKIKASKNEPTDEIN
jgi:hypothetical protein